MDKNVVICTMKILLTAATAAEIAPLINYMDARWRRTGEGTFTNGQHETELCITGVGMVAAAYSLTRVLAHRQFDMAIQTGIAGAFDRNLEPGDIVRVQEDCFGDLGAEDHETHIDIFSMGFIDADTAPFSGGRLVCPETDFSRSLDIPAVSALTVNMVSGNEKTIKRLADTYNCAIESMEGAAFHYICLSEGQPFVQLRSISNYIEPRDRSKWKIKEAIAELNDFLIFTLEDNNYINS